VCVCDCVCVCVCVCVFIFKKENAGIDQDLESFERWS
jgi:hypothetical protein